MRWSQVISTDYDNYLVLWSCFEHAEWYTTGDATYVHPSKVWDIAERITYDSPDASIPWSFELDEASNNIHRLNLRKTKVNIFWKPKADSRGKITYDSREVNDTLISELVDKIDRDFPNMEYKTRFARNT